MTQLDTDLDSTERRWLYGFNLGLLIAIGVAIITILMVMTANNTKIKLDMTGNGLYSLSSYTHHLLKQIDAKGQKYQLVSLFGAGVASQNENQREISDLLDEYAGASSNITYKEAADLGLATIQQEIRERYTGELKPYQDTVTQYKKVGDDLGAFARQEAANISALAQNPAKAKDQDFAQQDAQVQNLFGEYIPDMLARIKREIRRDTESTSPDWDKAVSAISEQPLQGLAMPSVQQALSLFANSAQVKDQFPALAPYFDAKPTAARYKAMNDEIKTFMDAVNKLKPLKVRDVLNSLDQNTVLVLGPSSAVVIPRTSLFKAQGNGAPGQPAPEEFSGEEAISSALLSMVQPDKVKVVFVTSAPTQITTSGSPDSWTDMADNLRQANFDVSEWSPPGPQTSPDQPPPVTTPPAEGKGVIWIVFPPDPDPQMMSMGMPPNPQPMIAAVSRHMAEGGQVLFLADSSMNPMGMPGGGEYAYASLIQPFGVTVMSKYLVVRDYHQQGQTRAFPQLAVNRYPPSEITDPLQSLQTMFRPIQNPRNGMVTGLPTVVTVDGSVPTGVTAKVIVQAPDDGDTWGETNFSATAKFDKGIDYAAPCPMAVAAEKKDKSGGQRIVVIGSRGVGDNDVVDEQSATLNDEGEIASVDVRNPGNSELVLNSVLWLAGYKNMIAVGSKAAAAQRIGAISPTMLDALRWLVLAILPAAVLVLGGVAWFYRRR